MKKILLLALFILSQSSYAQTGMPNLKNYAAASLFLSISGCRHYHPSMEDEISKIYKDFVLRTELDWPLELDPVNKEAVEKLFDRKLEIEQCNHFMNSLNNGQYDEKMIKAYQQ